MVAILRDRGSRQTSLSITISQSAKFFVRKEETMKKRIIALLIACIMVFGAMPVVTISAADYTPIEEQCTCDEANKTAGAGNTFVKDVAATCWSHPYSVYTHDVSTENGATPCGKTYIVITGAPTGLHTLASDPGQAATCTTDGWAAFEYCTASVHCPENYEAKKAANKIPAAHTGLVDLPAVAPDCTNTGLTAGEKCDDCGTITIAQNEVPANGHGPYTSTVTPPACEAEGYTTHVCDVCGHSYTDTTVPATGHTWVEASRVEASCYTDGHVDYTCACGATKTDVLPAPMEHDYEVIKTPATCQGPATEEHICKVCGYALPVITEGDALPHDEIDVPGFAATCTTDGLTDGKKCTVCGTMTVPQTVIPMLGHTSEVIPAVEPTCSTTGLTAGEKCSVCDEILTAQTEVAIDPLKHVAIITVDEIPATCMKEGSTYESHCKHCDILLHAPEPIPVDPDAHAYSSVVVDPTCVDDGYTKHTCDLCGNTYNDTFVTAPGHKYEDTVVAPTCVDAGYTTHTCSVCGDSYNDTDVPALGHTLTTTGAQAPTCTEIGWADYDECSVCDYTTYAEIPALGHNKGTTEGVVHPTCTEGGYTIYICDRTSCGIPFKSDFTDATGHTEAEIPAVAPTCTAEGATAGVKCSVCNTVLTAPTPVEKIDHTPVEIPAVAPTCTVDGATAGTKCSVCDTVITAPAVDPATGHTEVEIPAVAPTCTADGTTAGTKCSVCDAVVTAPAVVPATGHTPVEIPAIPADYNNTGMSAGEKCSVCEEILKAPTATSVLDESVKFTYTATGINGSTNAVNSGYIILDVYLNVETDIARLWAIDLTLNYDANLTLVKVEGLILNDMHYTALDTANAAHQVTLTQSMGATDPNSKTFEKGVYKFMTLTFKVDKNAKNYTANFDVDSGLVVRGDDVKDLNNLVVDLGTGASIRVTMLGDANGDGALNSKDSLEMTNWSIANSDKLDAYAECYDMNKDGIIDGVDYALLRMAVVHNNDYLDTDDYNLNP